MQGPRMSARSYAGAVGSEDCMHIEHIQFFLIFDLPFALGLCAG